MGRRVLIHVQVCKIYSYKLLKKIKSTLGGWNPSGKNMSNKEGTAGGFELDHNMYLKLLKLMTVLISHFHFGVWGLFMSAREIDSVLYSLYFLWKVMMCISTLICITGTSFQSESFQTSSLPHPKQRVRKSSGRPSILLPSLNPWKSSPIMKGSLSSHPFSGAMLPVIFKGAVVLAIGYLGGGFKSFCCFYPYLGRWSDWTIIFQMGWKTTK